MKSKIQARRKKAEHEVILILGLALFLILGSFCLGAVQNNKEINTLVDSAQEKAVSTAQMALTPFASQEEGVKAVNIIGNGAKAEPAMIELLTQYYSTYGRAMETLEPQDVTQFFSQSDIYTNTAAHFDQAYLDTLVGLRLNRLTDLKLNSYSIDLDLIQMDKLGEDTFTISLLENQDLVFASTPETHSYSTGTLSRFRLVRENNGWKISRHEKEGDLFLYMTDYVSEAGIPDEEQIPFVDQLKDEIIARAKAARASQALSLDQSKTSQAQASTNGEGYDRNAAIAYADTYALERNPDYEAYDDYGGNCNNFISQCLLAGGIQPDEFGEYVWYNDPIYGPSSSFILVNSFYDYAANNTEGGFNASVDDNIYSGQPGDILQFGDEGSWLHSVIITDVIKNRDDRTVDYLIDSNTADLKNFPASAYYYPDMRLIRILGSQPE